MESKSVSFCVVSRALMTYPAVMVTDKPWRSEAILRLILSVFVCHFLGVLALAVYRFASTGDPDQGWAFAGLATGAALFAGAALYVLRKPWELDRFTRSFATLLVCLYLCLMLGAFAQKLAGDVEISHPALRTMFAAISLQGIGLLFVWRFVREHNMTWSAAFGLKNDWRMALVYGVLVACAYLPFGWLLQEGSFKVLSFFNYELNPQPAVQALKGAVALLDRVAIGVTALVLAPWAEELVFRGILYPALKHAGFPRLAWWGTSLLFALVHAHLATFVPLFVFALALTWIYEKTGNLLAPIAAHAMFNALNFGVGLYEDEVFRMLHRLLNLPEM